MAFPKKYKKKKFKTRGELRSGLEQDVARQLKRAKVSFSFESEFLPYVLEKTYLPDFIVTTPSKKKIYIESKGWFKPEDRTKMKAVKKRNPDLDIRLLFSNDGKLSKNSKSRYSDWCKKNGFPYCFKRVPEEWFK